MSRIVKPADVRRREILDAALDLFAEHGYDATSVNRIIDRVGISKGAFYHHFRSKEEILRRVTDDLAAVVLVGAADVLNDPDATAACKLRALLAGAADRKRAHLSDARLTTLGQAIYTPANLRLRIALEEASIAHALPIFTAVIAAGQSTGELDPVGTPAVTAELLLNLGVAAVRAGAADLSEVTQRLATHRRAACRLLGLPADALDIPGATAGDRLAKEPAMI